MNEVSYFPLDIASVKQQGTAKWQRDFFWPVSDKEFVAMCEDLEACVRRHIEGDFQEAGDALMVKRNIVSEYWHFLHAVKVLDEIKKRGMQPLYCEAAFWYKDILEHTLEGKVSGISGKRTRLYSAQGGMFRHWKRKGKRLIKEILFNRSPDKIRSRIKGGVVYLYGAPDEFIAPYCKRLPQWVALTGLYDWLPKSFPPVPDNVQEEVRSTVARLMDDVGTIAATYRIPLGKHHFSYLEKFTEGQLMEAAQVARGIRTIVSGRRIHLLVSTVHDQIQRALALEVRRAGGTVSSFTHGGHIGYLNSPTIPFNEFALSDEFIAYTPASVEIFKELQRARKALRGNIVNISSGNGLLYRKFFEQHARKEPPSKITTVMLVGFPMAPWRKPQGSALFWPMQLELELRIAKMLQEAGYTVLYKAHPDRLKEIEGIFDNTIKIIQESFERVTDMADAFVFPVIRTTAFNFALCTNKSVVGFLMQDEYPSPLAAPLALLKKRCPIVYTHFDEKGRIQFEKNVLLDGLLKTPRSPDREFVETYLCP